MSDIAKEILKIASKAVKEAQRKSLENDVTNVYSKMEIFISNYQMEK